VNPPVKKITVAYAIAIATAPISQGRRTSRADAVDLVIASYRLRANGDVILAAVFARRKTASRSGRQTFETEPSDKLKPLPWPAAVADLSVVLLLCAARAIAITGGGVLRIGAVRLSMRSPWRMVVAALIVAAVRYYFVRQRPQLPHRWRGAREVLPLDEEQLFEAPGGGARRRRIGRATALVLGFTLLVLIMTWPQVRDFYSVPDLGDPLFSIWRIAWVSHQLPRDPLHLFDANIFYPERLTFTYSDSLIVPALMAAPMLWLGVHPVVAYNILFLSGFVLSGIAMFLLVRALTGRVDAAIVAGVIFTLYPYRYEHYSHLELQMTMWMPLALWSLHRTMSRGRIRDGILTGGAFALQMLSSLYYGVFLSVYMVVLGTALWIGRGLPRRPLVALAAGALVAAIAVAPVASQYVASKPMMGDRDLSTVQFYSAEGPDYLRSHQRSWTYSSWSAGGRPERQLFPRFTPVVLSAIALWPPLSVARIGYAAALVVAVDGSLGLNGKTFPWLRKYVPPFRGLRVPARFSILAGMTLAILAGYGATRLFRFAPGARRALSVLVLGLVIVEALPHIRLEPVWPQPPPIYASLTGASAAVLAEHPMPKDGNLSWFDTRYMYFSTWHWTRMVNGNSGFGPPSYDELLERELTFPSDASIDYLKARGVDYVTIHGAFMASPERYVRTAAFLDARKDFQLITAARWGGSESRLYRLNKSADAAGPRADFRPDPGSGCCPVLTSATSPAALIWNRDGRVPPPRCRDSVADARADVVAAACGPTTR
jgi:hypothetical protein